jgi:hypothetical protein
MARWFRFYDEALNDPKVQCLAPDLFKVWVNLLCVASKNDGTLPAPAELGFLLRIDTTTAEANLAALAKAGLLDKTKGSYAPHNWHGRQFKSDVSNERVKRHRKRGSNGDGNGGETVTRNGDVTPSESETEADTETETEQKASPSGAGGAAPPTADDLANMPEFLRRSTDKPQSAAPTADLKAKLFGPCLDWLASRTGKPANAHRALIGRWLKDAGSEGVLLTIFAQAQREAPIEPLAWIAAAIAARQRRSGKLATAFAGIADAVADAEGVA